ADPFLLDEKSDAVTDFRAFDLHWGRYLMAAVEGRRDHRPPAARRCDCVNAATILHKPSGRDIGTDETARITGDRKFCAGFNNQIAHGRLLCRDQFRTSPLDICPIDDRTGRGEPRRLTRTGDTDNAPERDDRRPAQGAGAALTRSQVLDMKTPQGQSDRWAWARATPATPLPGSRVAPPPAFSIP